MKRNLIQAERRNVVAHVVVAVAVLPAQFARQRRQNALARKWQQAAIRDFVEAVAQRVVSAQLSPANFP